MIFALNGELKARRVARELAGLDDRIRCDIGIRRSDIQRVVRQHPHTSQSLFLSRRR